MPPNNQPQNQFSQFPPKFTPPVMQNGPAVVPPPPQSMPPKPQIPNIPTIQMKPPSISDHKALKIIIGALIVIFVAIGVYVLINTKGVEQKTISSENVILKDEMKGIPAGFPKGIFIDEKNITQSSTLEYPERNTTLYAVAFSTMQQSEELFTTYGKYLKDSGYVLTNQTKSSVVMSYVATKANTELNIVITPQSPKTLVQISYVVRNK